MTKQASYEAGVKAALDSFNLQRRMPFGPGHLGAERLSQMLQSDHEAFAGSKAGVKGRSNLDRPTLWGPKTPVDSGGFAGSLNSSTGSFGGV